MSSTISRIIIVAAAAGMTVAGVSPRASSQTVLQGGGAPPSTFDYWEWIARPTWSESEIRSLMHSVGALQGEENAGRRTVMTAFHEEFLKSFHEGSAEIRAISEKAAVNRARSRSPRRQFREDPFDPNPAQSRWDALPQLQWEVRRGELEEAFLESVSALFDNDELAEWERAERQWRRESVITRIKGTTYGTVLCLADLTAIIDGMDLPESVRESIAPTVLEYERDLDRALREYSQEHSRLSLESWKVRERREAGEAVDEQRRAAISSRMEELHAEPQHITLRYRDRLHDALPLEHRDEFFHRCGEVMHPAVYLAGPADVALRGLMRDDAPIDAARRAQIEQIAAAFRAQRNIIHRQIAQRSESMILNPERFAARRQADWERYAAWRQRAQSEPEVFQVFEPEGMEPWRRRYELSEQTCRRLRGIFSQSELERLPAAVRLALSFEED